MSTRDEILRRAAKLASMTTAGGATAAEAEQAAERLGQLLREHNLSLKDVTAAQMAGDIESGDCASGFRRPPAWATHLAAYIACACDCRLLTCPAGMRMVDGALTDPGHRWSFVGHQADVAVATYFLGYLLQALPSLADRARPLHRPSFLTGAAHVVALRLREAIRPVGSDEAQQGALVQVKGAAIGQWMERTMPGLKSARTPPPPSESHSYRAGVAAGEHVPLHHGIARAADSCPRIA